MSQDDGLAACAVRNMIDGWAVWKTVIWLPFVLLTTFFITTGLFASPLMCAALNMLASCVFAGLIAVQWHRYEILQEKPVSISFTAKGALWCYAWRWLLFWGVTFVPALYIMAQLTGAEGWTALQMDQGIGPVAFVVALFVACVIVLALALTMPSTASRFEKISLGTSLQHTRQILPGIAAMALVIAVVMCIVVIATEPLTDNFILSSFRATFLLTIFLMLETVALAEIYRRVGPTPVPFRGRSLTV